MYLITFSKAGRDDIVLTEDDLFDFQYEASCFSGESFELGGVNARKLYLLIDNNTQRFSRGTFAGSHIKLEIDGVFMGYYNAELPKRRNGVIELTAYDNMVKLDVEFPADYTFPQTFWAVYAQCVYEAGLADEISFDNVILNGVWNNGVISADYTDYIYANSCRKLVSGMAEWNGGYARINDDGKLQIDKFSKTVTKQYSSGELMELDYSDETVTFTKIKTSQKNKTYEMGTDDGYTLVINNQYISYGLDDSSFELYFQKIYDYYNGFTLTPMTFTLTEPDLELHIGDRVQVFDEEEQVTITGNVSKIEITGNCSMTVTCGGFENVTSSSNYTPTSFSQIQQSKQEAKSDNAGSSMTSLISYQYLTDTSVKLNGVTYTVEKNADTGLISKISDSNGNSLEPGISAGITDVTLHNALFWAVAMARGLGSPDPAEEFIKSAIYRLYEPDGTIYMTNYVDTGIPQSRLTSSETGVTVAFVLKPSAWAPYYGLWGQHSGNDGQNIQCTKSSGGNSAHLYRHNIGFDLTAGEKYVLIISDQRNAADCYAMKNTVEITKGTPSESTSSAFGNVVLYNSYQFLEQRNYHGIAYDALIWDKALTRSEALAVAKRLMAQHNITGGNT